MHNIPGRQKLQKAYLTLKKNYIHFKEMKLAFVINFSDRNAKKSRGRKVLYIFALGKILTYLDFYLNLTLANKSQGHSPGGPIPQSKLLS